MLPGLPVRVRHGELVLIGEQRRRHGVGGRPHLRRHPRMGAVAVGVGARVRRRRLRHPGLPEELLGGGSALGLAWLRGRERLPRREGRGGEAGGDNWRRPEGGGGGGGRGLMGIWEFGREPNGIYTVGGVAGGPGGKRQMTPAPLLVVRFEPASANSVGCSIYCSNLQGSYSVTS